MKNCETGTRILLYGDDPVAMARVRGSLEQAGLNITEAMDLAAAAGAVRAGIDLVMHLHRLPNGLTPREREVQALLALGPTEKEVAHALGVAPSTVRSIRVRAEEKAREPGLLDGAGSGA